MPDTDRPRGAEPRRGRADAQRRVHRIRAFRAELEALSEAGVASLTTEQEQAIRQFHDQLLGTLAVAHDIDRSESAGQLSRGMRIAAFFAAVALSGAVYSLVSRFWGQLDLPVQATLLCAFPLMALVGVELAAQRERTLYVSSIFAIVAFATHWLAVTVLGDLLNLPMTPAAIWGGALFGTALALPYGFRLILGAALVAFLVALAGSVFQAGGVPWTALVEFPEIITVAAFLLLVTAPALGIIDPSFAIVTRSVSLVVGLGGLLLLSLSGAASLLPTPSWVSALIYQVVVGVAAVMTLAVGVRRQWQEGVYIGAGALTVFLFTRFVDWFWDALPRFVFFLFLALIALGWLFVLRRLRSRLDAGDAR